MEEHLGWLSPEASQVLLALLLARVPRTEVKIVEFALLLGMRRSTLILALEELSSLGLIESIPQTPAIFLVTLATSQEQPVRISGVEVAEEEATKRRTEDESPDPLTACREADSLEDPNLRRDRQIRGLIMVWNRAFPEADYPYQRLTVDAAKRYLSGGKAAGDIGAIILDAVEHATDRIVSPRGFIARALANAEARANESQSQSQSEGAGVDTDALWRLVALGKEQYHA